MMNPLQCVVQAGYLLHNIAFLIRNKILHVLFLGIRKGGTQGEVGGSSRKNGPVETVVCILR